VPGSVSASGRRLLDSAVAGSGKVQDKDGKPVNLEVRARAHALAAVHSGYAGHAGRVLACVTDD